MNLLHRRFSFSLLVLIASLMCVPATCSAELLPPGDFNGMSLNQWGLDYAEWSAPLVSPGFILPDPSRPDTVNGVRYLPVGPAEIKDFTANLTIEPGTALFASPFYFYGEQYDDGHSDDPADPLIQTILDEATVRVTLDGVVLLEGTAQLAVGPAIWRFLFSGADPVYRATTTWSGWQPIW